MLEGGMSYRCTDCGKKMVKKSTRVIKHRSRADDKIYKSLVITYACPEYAAWITPEGKPVHVHDTLEVEEKKL